MQTKFWLFKCHTWKCCWNPKHIFSQVCGKNVLKRWDTTLKNQLKIQGSCLENSIEFSTWLPWKFIEYSRNFQPDWLENSLNIQGIFKASAWKFNLNFQGCALKIPWIFKEFSRLCLDEQQQNRSFFLAPVGKKMGNRSFPTIF